MCFRIADDVIVKAKAPILLTEFASKFAATYQRFRADIREKAGQDASTNVLDLLTNIDRLGPTWAECVHLSSATLAWLAAHTLLPSGCGDIDDQQTTRSTP
jgi:hypothetical protein